MARISYINISYRVKGVSSTSFSQTFGESGGQRRAGRGRGAVCRDLRCRRKVRGWRRQTRAASKFGIFVVLDPPGSYGVSSVLKDERLILRKPQDLVRCQKRPADLIGGLG